MITDSIKKILVPTDMSDFGKTALHYAESFQEKFGSSVTAMFANEPFPVGMIEFAGGYSPMNSVELDQRLRRDLLNHVAETVSNPERFETLVVNERPAAAIVNTADRIGADLIIMGTHGRSGWRRAFLGSVAERVLRLTSRPVLTVTPAAAAATRKTIKSILCPVNLTPVSHDAVLEAAQVAKAFGAELVVMHVVEEDPPFYAAFEMEKWLPPAVRAHAHFRYIVVLGNAAERILETADSSAIDLIVMGAQHNRFYDSTVVGETTERITRFARQPVLTVVRREESEKAGKLSAA